MTEVSPSNKLSGEPPSQIDPASAAKRNSLPLLVLIITGIILAGIVGYYLGKGNIGKAKIQDEASLPASASATKQAACTLEAKICPDGSSVGRTGPDCEFAPCPTTLSVPSPLAENSLDRFSDPDLSGMEFDYDKSIWNIRKYQPEDAFVEKNFKNSGIGTIAVNIKTGDVLLFDYTLAFGMGGGINTFKQDDAVVVDNRWSRIKRDNSIYQSKPLYYFGPKDKLVYYSLDKTLYESMVSFCDDMSLGKDIYPVMSPEECTDLKSGKLAGQVEQPAYSRSFRLKRQVPLGRINSQWDNDRYIRETGIDDGYMIINISYYGDNPQEADKIVKQLGQALE